MATTARPDASTYAPPAAPAFDPTKVDVHAPSYSRDPYATYAQFRHSAPIALVAPYGSKWIFRHADVVAALADTETFVKNPPPPGGPPRAPGIFGVAGS